MFDKVNKPGEGAVTTLLIHKATAKSRITILNQPSALNKEVGVRGGGSEVWAKLLNSLWDYCCLTHAAGDNAPRLYYPTCAQLPPVLYSSGVTRLQQQAIALRARARLA